MSNRTCVYVDGFNLYYGSLRKTPYKWLDLKRLFSLLLPTSDILAIKYYTAIISAREDDPQGPIRQASYIRALEHYIPEFSVYYGHYFSNTVTMLSADSEPPNKKFVKVIKTEEKGSDVNLALHLLNDAWLNEYDCAVLVSNDSDLAESLRLVKQQHNKKIGLITPGDPKVRKPTRKLKDLADFRTSIRAGVLAESQLPDIIPGTKIHKPLGW